MICAIFVSIKEKIINKKLEDERMALVTMMTMTTTTTTMMTMTRMKTRKAGEA